MLPYLAAFNVAATVGTAVWGRLSETALGRRGAVSITLVNAMTVSMLISAAFAATALWLGPETRGRRFVVD